MAASESTCCFFCRTEEGDIQEVTVRGSDGFLRSPVVCPACDRRLQQLFLLVSRPGWPEPPTYVAPPEPPRELLSYCDGCGVRVHEHPREHEVPGELVPYTLLDMHRLKRQAEAMMQAYGRSYPSFNGRDHATLCPECKKRYPRPEPMVADDPVSHPAHYTFGKLEVIQVIDDWGWGIPFCLGNTIKYAARAGRKDPSKRLEDLQKARWYLDHAIELVIKEGG